MAPDVRVTPGTVCKGFYAHLIHLSALVSWRWRWGWQWRCAGFVVRTTGPAAQGWVFEPPLAPVGWSSFQRLVDCCGWSLMRWELQLSCCLAVQPDICPCSCRKVKKKRPGGWWTILVFQLTHTLKNKPKMLSSKPPFPVPQKDG